MLKCDVLLKMTDVEIDFDKLEVGDTFIISDDGFEWIGMKVSGGDYDYILDLSDSCGKLYDDVEEYKIVRMIDLKVVKA